jgi:hypothetical protein
VLSCGSTTIAQSNVAGSWLLSVREPSPFGPVDALSEPPVIVDAVPPSTGEFTETVMVSSDGSTVMVQTTVASGAVGCRSMTSNDPSPLASVLVLPAGP